jgi:hypothetical protein
MPGNVNLSFVALLVSKKYQLNTFQYKKQHSFIAKKEEKKS